MPRRKEKCQGRNSAKVAKFEKKRSQHAHESMDRKDSNRIRMRVIMLQRQADELESRLKKFPKVLPDETKVKEKGRSGPEDWKLKGAARPAAMLAKIENGELDSTGKPMVVPTYEDLYSMYKGRFGENEHTKKYLELRFALGNACRDANLGTKAIPHFQACVDLDEADALLARDELICAYVDEGLAAEGRLVIQNCKVKSASALYSLLLIEYVAWKIVEEQDASETVAAAAFHEAFRANPYIAVFICGYEVFEDVVECVHEIKDYQPGSIEESFVYCTKNVGVWLDMDGIREWVVELLNEQPEPKADESNCNDTMFLGMYQTAVDMIKES